MTVKQHISVTRRDYNKWVANETLEDFALRYTAKRARKWSGTRIANTALGIVSFLALEAIGGAITLNYGFTNAMWAILVVCGLIFLTGLPICYYAARYGVDIDLLTRGAGFGYIGSTVSSLIYASFTFIFFALEAAIMSMALELLFGIPLSFAYIISAIVVIPLVTHGITRISRFQLWTQPIWITLQIAPLVVILVNHADAVASWTQFTGLSETGEKSFNMLLFGAAAAVIFPLMAQNGEQVDFLRFLPKEQEHTKKWWLALVLSGPGWVIVGLIKLFVGSFLAVLALQHGIEASLADDPAHMYMVAFGYLTQNPDLAIVLAGVFVIISQLKINVTNAYAGSIAWSNFFSRLTHNHPGRVVWLFFNVIIALLLMELGLYHAFESILITYSALVLAWVGSLVADLVINKPLGLRPPHIEFKRGHLYDINPVGAGSMLIASTLGISGQLGLFGPEFKALSPFVALFSPFVTAPLIAYFTRGKYYLARPQKSPIHENGSQQVCRVCENHFDSEDISSCPTYDGPICSLCCALDSRCQDQCRPEAHIKAQTFAALSKILPLKTANLFHSVTGHFLVIFFFTSTLIAGLLALVYFPMDHAVGDPGLIVKNVLWQVFFLLLIVTGVLVWLYVLAENSRRNALEESQKQTQLLSREVLEHEQTASQLHAAKEAAEAANQAKSRYLSGVSHELRTPLNNIFGYAQLLENDQSLGDTNHHAAAVIRRSGEHLTDVIEGLLEISKIEARRLDLHRDQVKISAVIEQLVEMFSMQAREKGINFSYQCESELPTYVTVDEKRLRQILMNLLSNAIKFTSEGSVSLRLSYRNEVAKFIVTDSGIGIKPEDQQRIFDPFERILSQETQFIKGTGLGLAISRLLADLMGGEISLQSDHGKGATFTLSILLPAVVEPRAQDVSKKQICGYAGPAKNILVVDDEPEHRGLIIQFLSPLGFHVFEANNAATGLELAADIPIDLFLLDVSMPAIDGWQLAAKLKQAGHASPIIMISANAIEDHRDEMTGPLHDDYLIKPVRLDVLMEKIGSALNLSWTYDDHSTPPAPAHKKLFIDPDKLPSKDELDELISLASIGFLNGVQEKLEGLEHAGKDPAFISHLKAQADSCNLDGIIRAINKVNHESATR